VLSETPSHNTVAKFTKYQHCIYARLLLVQNSLEAA